MAKKYLEIYDTSITSKNFSGRPNDYGNTDRSFCVVIPNEELAVQLKEDGWNIKVKRDQDGNTKYYYLPVKCNLNCKYPPQIFVSVDGGQTYGPALTEKNLNNLDKQSVYIDSADVRISPRIWDRGIKAYIQEMYLRVSLDTFTARHNGGVNLFDPDQPSEDEE